MSASSAPRPAVRSSIWFAISTAPTGIWWSTRIRTHRDELSHYAKAMREQRDKVKALLRAPEFDRQAAEEASAEMRRLGDEMQAALGKAILEAVEKLPPEARHHLAD